MPVSDWTSSCHWFLSYDYISYSSGWLNMSSSRHFDEWLLIRMEGGWIRMEKKENQYLWASLWKSSLVAIGRVGQLLVGKCRRLRHDWVNCFVLYHKVSFFFLWFDWNGQKEAGLGRIAWLSHLVDALLSNGSLDRSTFMLRHFLLHPGFPGCVGGLRRPWCLCGSTWLHLFWIELIRLLGHPPLPQRSNKLLKYPLPLLPLHFSYSTTGFCPSLHLMADPQSDGQTPVLISFRFLPPPGCIDSTKETKTNQQHHQIIQFKIQSIWFCLLFSNPSIIQGPSHANN